MTQYRCKIRYTDDRGRSHNIVIESDLSDRRYIEQLARAQYPIDKIYINSVSEA